MNEYSERAYTINVLAVNRLRKQRSMSWETLAEKALVHVTTLRAWRKGRPAFLGNIKRLADALGADVKDIVDGWQDDIPQEEQKSLPIRDYDIKIDENFPNWEKDKQDQFLEGLRLILATGSEVRIMGKANPGCVKLRLRLTPEQAEKLERAFDTGQLAGLKIIEITPVSVDVSLPPDTQTTIAKQGDASEPEEKTPSQRVEEKLLGLLQNPPPEPTNLSRIPDQGGRRIRFTPPSRPLEKDKNKEHKE